MVVIAVVIADIVRLLREFGIGTIVGAGPATGLNSAWTPRRAWTSRPDAPRSNASRTADAARATVFCHGSASLPRTVSLWAVTAETCRPRVRVGRTSGRPCITSVLRRCSEPASTISRVASRVTTTRVTPAPCRGSTSLTAASRPACATATASSLTVR